MLDVDLLPTKKKDLHVKSKRKIKPKRCDDLHVSPALTSLRGWKMEAATRSILIEKKNLYSRWQLQIGTSRITYKMVGRSHRPSSAHTHKTEVYSGKRRKKVILV